MNLHQGQEWTDGETVYTIAEKRGDRLLVVVDRDGATTVGTLRMRESCFARRVELLGLRVIDAGIIDTVTGHM